MYRYSRAIYRSIRDLIDPYVASQIQLEYRRAVLEQCELAMERLAKNPLYFAKPDRALFQDIRRYFPITCQAQVAWAVREGATNVIRHSRARAGPGRAGPPAPAPAPRHIVVTASVLARIAVPVYTGYSASKAGLLGLVRSLAAELAAQNVQVNAVCPGWVKTEMTWEGLDAMPGTREEAHERAMREVPLRRMSEPEEIAGTVAWLLSDDARGVTGQAIDQNNGAYMG